MSQGKINSLQLLRAVAVGLVIFVHAINVGVSKLTDFDYGNLFYNFNNWGAIGVDLFFAISGFIMTIVAPAYTKPGGWKKFFAKRIIRIVPLYYLLSGIDALLTVYLQHKHISFEVAIKTLIFIPVFDQGHFVTPLISVGWSLSFEVYFYALIGIVLLLKKRINEVLLVILVILSGTGLLLNDAGPLLKFLTSPMLLEFGFGILCGMLYKWFNTTDMEVGRKKMISIVLTGTGLILMLGSIFLNSTYKFYHPNVITDDNFIAFYRVVVWGLPAAIFMLGVIFLERSFKKDVPVVLILSGDASYSCYLIHGMIYPIVASVFKYLSLGPTLYLITIVPVCIGISIVFYQIVERPMVTGIDKLLNYKKPVIMQ
ncbi:acyltransferase family protein [Pedobacter metabolipauper]|uniref:Peptidoglycan/LPS O-acetylase OafA/YrhL n=1 Tax=Pedobacter metabolipauper TaxID=425513 RepID=A0A4R6SX23_9SPHI|nr:acyltransferase [Pedobacter metabolipauper]TDQ10001.1 peptidoglycan/LPS O-acetylase OafA/YrhL [Pedobacter metabolipauper]